jgi:hypothetical protein
LGIIDRFLVSISWILEYLPKRSDIKEIGRPDNGTSEIQSAVAYTFSVYAMKLGDF